MVLQTLLAERKRKISLEQENYLRRKYLRPEE